MVTVGPNGSVFWDYPETEEPNIDRFNVYVNGDKKSEALPSDRSKPISELVSAAGNHVVDIAAENAMGEGPKGSAEFRLVTGVPLAVTNVRVG